MGFFKPAHHEIAAKYPYEIELGGSVMVFQPHDGTRYEFIFTEVSDACALLGCSPQGVMVTLMRGPNQYVSAVFDGYAYPTYIQEKLGVNRHTAEVVARVLKFALKKQDIGPFEEAQE